MKIEARILYQEIATDNKGLYVWVDPDERSVVGLTRLLMTAPADVQSKSKDCTEMHLTILHCRSSLPSSVDLPDDHLMEGRLSHLEVWEDHKGRMIMVAHIDSEAIRAVHKQLIDSGLEHSHHAYNPHITLAKDISFTPEVKLWVERVNSKLRENELIVSFLPQIKGSSIT